MFKFFLSWVEMPLWDQRRRKSSKEHDCALCSQASLLAEVGSCQVCLGLVALTCVSEGKA